MEWAAVAWSRMRASASPVPSDELRDVVRVELRSRERDDGEMAGRPRWKLAARVSAGDGAGGPAGVLQPLEGDQRVQVAAGPDAVTYLRSAHRAGDGAHRRRGDLLDRRMASARR